MFDLILDDVRVGDNSWNQELSPVVQELNRHIGLFEPLNLSIITYIHRLLQNVLQQRAEKLFWTGLLLLHGIIRAYKVFLLQLPE